MSRFAPGTEVLTSDSAECSQACAQSLMRRSKHLRSNCYLREWKAGNLMRLRSGAISNHSHGAAFTGWWTSSLEVIPASHSVPQESGLEQKTRATSGPTSATELNEWLPGFASLRMSKGTLRWDSPQSSAIWKNWITERRGAYLARLKSALHINENVCSSWPTATARDWKGCGNAVPRRDGKQRLDTLEAVVMFGQAAPANHSTHGNRPELWRTPSAQIIESKSGEIKLKNRKPDDPQVGLADQVRAWATPQASDHVEGRRTDTDSNQKCLGRDMKTLQVSGKLNPRWVETLMGLPVGWVMPSCSQPVTIAPTSCAFSVTESCPSQPSERSVF